MGKVARLLVLAAAAVASGCIGPQVHATSQSFHRLPPKSQPTYAFAPLPEQEGTLEYGAYEDLVRAKLAEHGWTEVPRESADVVVVFQYYIDNGQPRMVTVPTWGQTGVSGSRTTGTVTSYGGMSTYSGTTTYTPTYGVTGYVPVTTTVFTRRLDLYVFQRPQDAAAKPRPVYEGKVLSQGSTGILSSIMPYMVRALFEEFPGESGGVRNVEYYAP